MGLQDKPEHADWGPARLGIEGHYHEMNRLLADRDYLAGSFSYADIAFYMAQFFAARMGVPMTSALPHLSGWRVRVSQRPAVRHVAGAMTEFLRQSNRPVPTFT